MCPTSKQQECVPTGSEFCSSKENILGLIRQKWNDTAAFKTKQKSYTMHVLPPTSQLLLVVVEGQEYRHQRRGFIGKYTLA